MFSKKAYVNRRQHETNPFCETPLETRDLRQAADWTEYTLAQIFDDTLILFYFTSKDQRNVVPRKFELYYRP